MAFYAEAIFHYNQFPEGKYRNWIANAANVNKLFRLLRLQIKPTHHYPTHRSGSDILTGSLVASPTNVSIHYGQAAAFSQFEFVTCMQLNHKSNITKHAPEKSLSRAVFANTGLFLRPHIQQPESHTQ
jgi:hypothetical protein